MQLERWFLLLSFITEGSRSSQVWTIDVVYEEVGATAILATESLGGRIGVVPKGG